MADKSSFISIPSIIFMILVYNIFFGDGDDKKEVKVVENDKPVIEQTVDEPIDVIKKDVKVAIKDAKKAFKQLKKDVIEEVNPEEKKPEEEKEVVVEEKIEIPKPLPKKPETTNMKKL